MRTGLLAALDGQPYRSIQVLIVTSYPANPFLDINEVLKAAAGLLRSRQFSAIGTYERKGETVRLEHRGRYRRRLNVRTPLLLFLLLGLGRDLAGLEGRGLARIHDISQVVAGQLRVVRDDLARQ